MWQERAALLNERPVYGRLQRLPNGMKDSNYLKDCIRLDYVRVWKIFKNMVQGGARDTLDHSKMVRLPPEDPFVLKLQSYRGKIVLGALLLDCFTGMPPSRLRIQPFVLHKSDNTILLHIPSQEQARYLFLIGNLNAAEFESKNNLLFYFLCLVKCISNMLMIISLMLRILLNKMEETNYTYSRRVSVSALVQNQNIVRTPMYMPLV